MGVRKAIPNTITSMNLLCGVMGVIFTFKDRPDIAFCLMLAAAVFDFLDGLAARALGAYSDIGKELDSLCDVVSFGVLPALMLHRTMVMQGGETPWSYFPLVLAVFSALRLAKFNIDERQHAGFLGLPTPAAAMICGALCCFAFAEPGTLPARFCATAWGLPFLAVLLSALLVCELPMFAMKFGKGIEVSRATRARRIAFFCVALVGAIITAAFGLHWSLAVLTAFLGYVLVNLI
ncbi:MAG: CDP-diacylglycerol--serine O-phosphatidyltransferase [Bacteroidales bacterium]|nr:CDP-diacylglycerol--serine O-phosphatidyltransferase [Bacteroidales bacterium]MBR4479549.1 CDP-diacylglycerol--serine O-phosphatidyltransferase [Bacteroidales bacterium]